MPKIYSVFEITKYIKGIFSTDMLLSDVSVQGELSNLKFNPSGHIYFSLKGDNGKNGGTVIAGVMFGGVRAGLQGVIQDGDQVVVTGRIDVYDAQGRYQLYATKIQKAGEGDMKKKFEELKKKLQEEGLFDPVNKKPIPKYPMRVGIVSSQTAAGLQDILNIAKRRNPFAQIILSPAIMQGESAPKSIIAALQKLDAIHPDVIMIARGGGAAEDLWCFNDEELANAVFYTETPVVSAVGHEIDFTILDFVADLRMPTPSAAAEVCFFDVNQYLSDLDGYSERMKSAVSSRILELKNRVLNYKTKIVNCHPKNVLLKYQKTLSDYAVRMKHSIEQKTQNTRHQFMLLSQKLEGLSPLRKLVNGFGYVSVGEKPVESVSELQVGQNVKLTMHDGMCDAEVKGIQLTGCEIESLN